MDYLEPKTSRDRSTIATETIERLESKWQDIPSRMEIVDGKGTLRRLRDRVQHECGVTLTDIRIIDAFRAHEVPEDLMLLLRKMEAFRTG